jgi:hypothetical protein
MTQQSSYTCNDYRLEMILLALQRKLEKGDLAEEEKKALREEIRRVESQMGMG